MMMKKITGFFLAFLLFGCSAVIETTTTKPVDSSIGFYYLPMGVLKLDIVRITQGESIGYQLSCQPMLVPDLSQKYYLHYDQSFSSHDNIHIELDAQQFLKKVKIESEDVSDELIVKLAEIVPQALKVATFFPGDKEEVSIDTVNTIYFSINDESKELNDLLKEYKLQLTIQKLALSIKPEYNSDTKERFEGVLYKPVVPYQLEVRNTDDMLLKSSVLSLPDDEIIEFDISRAAFVKKVTEIEFDKGVLTEFSIDKPSQSLELVSIPVNILKSIVAIPTDLIQLKIDLSSKNTELIEAQKEEIEAKEALIELLESMKDNQEASTAESGDPF